jgi:hypothetical protein
MYDKTLPEIFESGDLNPFTGCVSSIRPGRPLDRKSKEAAEIYERTLTEFLAGCSKT